ncbi:hypothetical protein BT96DRAFT_1020308, partial [Gymnopus androsaceus JB14]
REARRKEFSQKEVVWSVGYVFNTLDTLYSLPSLTYHLGADELQTLFRWLTTSSSLRTAPAGSWVVSTVDNLAEQANSRGQDIVSCDIRLKGTKGFQTLRWDKYFHVHIPCTFAGDGSGTTAEGCSDRRYRRPTTFAFGTLWPSTGRLVDVESGSSL